MPAAHAYTHPGVPLTLDDLNTLKANLNSDPWKSGYAALQADGRSSLSYTMQGPFAQVARNLNGTGTDINLGQWRNDMQAVFNLSLMWQFTGNADYAQKARDIIIAWANTQTSFEGYEASFDLGDYAHCYAGGTDILRGTWSGWTTADTNLVKAYFANVFWPNCSVPLPVGSGSQGMEGLTAAVAIAAFNDDTTKFNQVLAAFLNDADAGLRDTLSNGQVGDTGRDQGHTSLYVYDLAFIAEVFWKQGVDVYSVMDNRILAAGEYYARYNLPGPAPAFVRFGAPFWGPFSSIGDSPRSSGQSRRALNILHGAYVARKGQIAPWISQYRNDQTEDATSFVFRKSADPSTATMPTVPGPAAAATVTTGLTSANLNGCVPAGATSYSNGIWTLNSGYNGGDPWYSNVAADTVRFAYKQLAGDFTIIAKVESVSNAGSSGAKAGIMMRDSLGATFNRTYVAITPGLNYERCMRGWTSLPYGSNAESQGFAVPSGPYWVRMERSGNQIQTFTSPNGGDWSPAGTADFANLPASVYVGLMGCSSVSNTLNTATFSNVRITGGDGALTTASAAPFSLLAAGGDRQVQLRWNESLGATSYRVKRSTTSGSGYSTIATVSQTTYTDTSAINGTTYYYVVSAVNSAGESSNTAQDTATAQATLAGISFGGTATASANGGSGTEGADKALDLNPATKWYNGNAGTSGWIQYDFGAGRTEVVKGYAITSANDIPGRDPRTWVLYGFNDPAGSWTQLDNRPDWGSAFSYRYQTYRVSIPNTTAYRYYRLQINTNNGDANGLQLSEFALLSDQGRLLPDGRYRLLNRKSNKALDVDGGSTADGARVQQWTYGGYTNQMWDLSYQGSGQYKLTGVGSGKVMNVSGGSTSDGANVVIWPWSGANHQKWTLTPTSDGYFKLTAVHSGKAADVSGGSTANGASVIQWPYGAGTNQQWSITAAP